MASLRSDLTLLQEALFALTQRNPPKLHVVRDHLERVIDSIKERIEKTGKKAKA